MRYWEVRIVDPSGQHENTTFHKAESEDQIKEGFAPTEYAQAGWSIVFIRPANRAEARKHLKALHRYPPTRVAA